ncbi:PfkB family carbohydrate kinase [Candidatus Neptunochlamydia vexilliferae]|uniref:Bifunctional protein HldE n=1 Tax=Candidatus Neptunichlamydia vexilliferae TaxID=1651774 RepID=A0ABS0AY48_9BACT|nr:PfkB family carbohydrate kinase [Candidatus Neptunochlamydia vexilliferae]MBF5059048.1 Bifunctional protein HldE [Candidatus Neptunochlamydia vexilliferae]
MQSKIKTFEELEEILESEKKEGEKIVHCHGVFDLLHPGHIRHFKEAKEQGTKLVVSITPDAHVNKGPGRPAFNEELRTETLAALNCVDYVVLNDSPDAVSCIKKIKPNVYVKGKEYADHGADVTGKISEETAAVEETQGTVYYTDDIVFSSSSLLNQYYENISPELRALLAEIKEAYSVEDLIGKVEALKDLKVLIVGDAIIDEYQFTEPMGQSGKGLHMVARCRENERYLGGSLIIANHIAQFSDHVTLLTSIGAQCSHRELIDELIDPKVKQQFIHLPNHATLTKKRYVMQDGNRLSKLFETYSTNDSLLSSKETEEVITYLKEQTQDFDLILVCDFGNGFTNPRIVDALSDLPNFLAINTQTNSGNRGFNVVTHYRRADFISLNEPELRLSAHDRYSSIEGLAADISEILQCKNTCITQGVRGVFCSSDKEPEVHIPALVTNTIDRVGAGDSFFAIAALCAAKGYPLSLAGFLGSIASAINVQTVGNKEPVKKVPFNKFLTRLLK